MSDDESGNSPPPVPSKRDVRGASISPVVLTALVYPGAGQLLQRRWVAAAVSALAFTATGAWFAVATAKVLIDYYNLAFDFAHAPESAARPGMVVVPFLAAMGVYLASLMDVVLASIRRRGRVT